MEIVVIDKYEIQEPAPENLVALFEDQWVTSLPGLPYGDVGPVPVLDDISRVSSQVYLWTPCASFFARKRG